MSLDRLFHAESVAVVGASRQPTKRGYQAILTLQQEQFRGAIYPVNPKEKKILGLPCYPTVSAIPGPVDLALITTRFHTHAHKCLELPPETLLELLQGADALRRPHRFDQFLLACKADSRGRQGHEEEPYPQREYLQAVRAAAAAINAAAAGDGASGKAMARAVRELRLAAIAGVPRPAP